MRLRTILKLASMLFLAAAASAQTAASKPSAPAPQWADLILLGEQHLKVKEFNAAVLNFVKAEELARQSGNTQVRADSYFFAALARQQQAATEGNAEWLTEAAKLYGASIKLQPSGAALNNLAQIWQTGENSQNVRELYERAIALKDEHQGTYALNYARWLEEQGQFTQAIANYRLAASRIPDDPALLKRVVELLAKHGSSEHDTMGYLWDLSCRGEADRVVEETLALSDNIRFRGLDEQVAILAYALSRSSSARVRTAMEDARLKNWAEANAGAKDIVKLLRGAFDQPSEFSWWSNRGGPPETIACHYSPLEAFRLLARSIGYRNERTGRTDAAERFYRVAVSIGPDEADPNAFVDLANLYTKTNQREKLTTAAGEFEQRLFHGKGLEYQRGAYKGVYDYHRALGVMYGSLGIWENPQRPYASALYQLENAEKAAARINSDDNWRRYGLEGPLKPDPALKILLGEGYAKTNQRAKSVKFRLDAAEEYTRRGDAATAREAVAPLIEQGSDIPQPEKERLLQIQQRIREMPVPKELILRTLASQTLKSEDPIVPAMQVSRPAVETKKPVTAEGTLPGGNQTTTQLITGQREELARYGSAIQLADKPADPLKFAVKKYDVRIEFKEGTKLRLDKTQWKDITTALSQLRPESTAEDVRKVQKSLGKVGIVDIDATGTKGRITFQHGKERISVPFELVPVN